MAEPSVTVLESGYLHVRWSGECWAQIPVAYSGATIADEYIFNAEWNRERVNQWWQEGNRG